MLIIFDCDGVLIDSELLACDAVAMGLGNLGLKITGAEILGRYAGISSKTMYADLEERYGILISEGERRRINQVVEDVLTTSVEAMPGVRPLLRDLAGRVEFCVASSSSLSRIRACLRHAGLDVYLGDRVFSAEQVPRGKPAPDLFLHAATVLKTMPADCLVVEDSRVGVQAAVAASMRCIGFVGGSHASADLGQSLVECGAAAVLTRMSQLPSHLSCPESDDSTKSFDGA